MWSGEVFIEDLELKSEDWADVDSRSETGGFVSSLPLGVGQLPGQAPEIFGFVV